MLTWKIVGASKASVLYIYIDNLVFSIEMFRGFLSSNYQFLTKNKKKKTLINAPVNHYGRMVIRLSMFLGMSMYFNLPSSIKLNVL